MTKIKFSLFSSFQTLISSSPPNAPKTEIWRRNNFFWVENYDAITVTNTDPLCIKNILAYSDYAIIFHPVLDI
jgi:hypothetical protein